MFLQNLPTMNILDLIFYRTLFYDFCPVISPSQKVKNDNHEAMTKHHNAVVENEVTNYQKNLALVYVVFIYMLLAI
jgi:hypothetical protein